MKKAIIAGILSALVSGSAFAAVDGWDGSWGAVGPVGGSSGVPENALSGGKVDKASVQLTFKGALPLVSPGEYVTITGLNGATLVNGELELLADGSFGTLVPVITEVHKYNADSKDVGPILTDADATKIGWTMTKKPVVSAVASDVTGASAKLIFNGTELPEIDGSLAGEGLPSAMAQATWGVQSTNPINKLVSGDEITVTSTVDVAVEF